MVRKFSSKEHKNALMLANNRLNRPSTKHNAPGGGWQRGELCLRGAGAGQQRWTAARGPIGGPSAPVHRPQEGRVPAEQEDHHVRVEWGLEV